MQRPSKRTQKKAWCLGRVVGYWLLVMPITVFTFIAFAFYGRLISDVSRTRSLTELVVTAIIVSVIFLYPFNYFLQKKAKLFSSHLANHLIESGFYYVLIFGSVIFLFIYPLSACDSDDSTIKCRAYAFIFLWLVNGIVAVLLNGLYPLVKRQTIQSANHSTS